MRSQPLGRGVFILLLLVWTWKLLEPNPVPVALEQELPADWRYWISKALHFGIYLLLCLLGLWGLGQRWRWAVPAFLVLHAGLTELAQTWVPNRHGSLRDVLIDSGGIAVGVLVSRWWSRRPPLNAP
jgi:VanZ family protein